MNNEALETQASNRFLDEFVRVAREAFITQLWHDGGEDPQEAGIYLLHVYYNFGQEDSYHDYITAYWDGNDWKDDHFNHSADKTIIVRWISINELIQYDE